MENRVGVWLRQALLCWPLGLTFLVACGDAATSNNGTGGNASAAGSGGTPSTTPNAGSGGGAGSSAVAGSAGATTNTGGSSGGVGGSAGGSAGSAGAGAAAPIEYAELFDDQAMPQFDLELSPEAIAALGDDPYTYQHGTLKFAGQTYADVGIRLKGRTSAVGQDFTKKPAFKIKLNEFVKGQKLLGLKRLTLNNMTQDPTLMHERLGYSYYRSLGLPAPRANHAKVYVNGQYFGVYLNLQSLDDVFVKEHYPGTEVGNLFDITNYDYFIDFDRGIEPPAQETKFVLETNETPPDISDLTALIDAVSLSSDDQFMANTEAELNLDEVLALGAAQAVIADWDGYFGARNNYKAYHDTGSDRFVLFPWGIDQSFDPLLIDYAIDHSQSMRPRSLVYDRCALHPECLARYHAKVKAAVTTFTSLPLASRLDAWQAQIKAAVEMDTRQSYSAEVRTLAIQELYGFVQGRAAKVSAQLPP